MEILIISLLLLINGLFAMYEIALVSSRRSRLQENAKFGSKGAKTALLLLKKPEEILSAIQVGITLVGIVSGAFGGIALSEDMVPVFSKIPWLAPYADILAVTFVVGIITYFSLIIGELVPKTIALNNPEKIAIALSPAMKIIGSVLYPVVWFLSVSTKLVLVLFRIKKTSDTPVSEEELRMLLKQGSEHGVIEKEESDIINEVIRFGDKRAGSIMTPRVDVEWINSTDKDEKILSKLMRSSHSRMPVCTNTVDEVLGVVAIKDVFAYHIKHQFIDINKIMTEPLFFPEQMSAISVLELFRKTKNHFGIVINEYGSMEGIVTLHDVTENIMGDLPESTDEDQPAVFRREDGSWLIDGSMMIEDVQDLLDLHSLFDDDEVKANINTLGGLTMFKLNRIPKIGDTFIVQGYTFEIVDMDGNRVDKLMVILK
jgi:putative hemolysin